MSTGPVRVAFGGASGRLPWAARRRHRLLHLEPVLGAEHHQRLELGPPGRRELAAALPGGVRARRAWTEVPWTRGIVQPHRACQRSLHPEHAVVVLAGLHLANL